MKEQEIKNELLDLHGRMVASLKQESRDCDAAKARNDTFVQYYQGNMNATQRWADNISQLIAKIEASQGRE